MGKGCWRGSPRRSQLSGWIAVGLAAPAAPTLGASRGSRSAHRGPIRSYSPSSLGRRRLSSAGSPRAQRPAAEATLNPAAAPRQHDAAAGQAPRRGGDAAAAAAAGWRTGDGQPRQFGAALLQESETIPGSHRRDPSSDAATELSDETRPPLRPSPRPPWAAWPARWLVAAALFCFGGILSTSLHRSPVSPADKMGRSGGGAGRADRRWAARGEAATGCSGSAA